jgi:nucleotide-binding universal stress UspA family protein
MPIEPYGPVIVGVDGSAAGSAALELAAEEAMGRIAPLVVVHAYAGTAQRSAARRLLAVAAASAEAEHPGLSVTAELVAGDAAGVLLGCSGDASLLVLGHGNRRGGRPAAGSVASQVVAGSRVPVMVHRPLYQAAPVRLPRPVLVGVADPDCCDSALGFAFAEADIRGTALVAMHVWAIPADTGPIGMSSAQPDLPRGREDAHHLLEQAIARWAEKYPQVRTGLTVSHGIDVPIALTGASRAAQLVVVGASHHRSGHDWTFEALATRAGCPVALIPAR